MTKPECPLPQVEDALTPYIHTREKATRIRQILTTHVTRQIKDDSKPTHLSLSIPPSSLQVTSTPPSSNGLYDQYLQALKAHTQARERYDTVKGELNQIMQNASEQDAHHQTSSNKESVQEYADLLRQRRHLRKLEIVQDALTKLLDVDPNPASTDIKATIKEQLGDPPQVPVVVAPSDGSGSEADTQAKDLTFQLKKELLMAKNKLADAKAAKLEAEKQASERSELDKSQTETILRNARDELITWVETELAKIPEDEVEASQVEISFLGDEDEVGEGGRQLTNEELSSRVDQLYEQYLQSRQRYIEEVEKTMERALRLQDGTQASAGAETNPQSRPVSATTSITKPPTISAADLLPSLTHLNTTAHSASLLQSQTAHLRKQLIIGSSETQTLIQRLAGESLLVPQDSRSVAAWSKAAQEASEKTKESVMANVIEGEASVAQAKKVLEGLKARRRGLESLRRDL